MKEKIMSKAILPIICATAAIILSLVNLVTAPVIRENENSITAKALDEISGGSKYSKKVDVDGNLYIPYYYSTDKGYILGLTTNGYGGEMTLLASLDKNGNIVSVKMLSNNETPGVGKKAENEGYMDMFIGTGNSKAIPTTKDMLSEEELTFVSGATLTFSGISKALNAASEFVKSL